MPSDEAGLQSRTLKLALAAAVTLTALWATAVAAGYLRGIGAGGVTCDGPCPTTGVHAVEQMTIYAVVATLLGIVAWEAYRIRSRSEVNQK